MRRVVYFTVLLPHGSNKLVGRHKASDKGPEFLPQGIISEGAVGPLMTRQTMAEGRARMLFILKMKFSPTFMLLCSIVELLRRVKE